MNRGLFKRALSRRCFLRAAAVLFAAVTVAINCAFAQVGELRAESVAVKLDELRQTIAGEVEAVLKTNVWRGSYTTIWRQFEDAAIDALCEVLPRHISGLSETNFDRGRAGREKNRTADLALVLGTNRIEISIKAARSGTNPENDMGTFRDHPLRKKMFAASFTLWVRYRDAGTEIECDRVFFDRTWRFVGKSSLVDGVKYRKKDGNMRPKPWAMFDAGESFWENEEDFEAAVKRAEAHRANSLVEEHLRDLTEDDQRLLYERLRQRFGGPEQGEAKP